MPGPLTLVPCPCCRRHVRRREARCPFCSAVLAAAFVGASAALGCSGDPSSASNRPPTAPPASAPVIVVMPPPTTTRPGPAPSATATASGAATSPPAPSPSPPSTQPAPPFPTGSARPIPRIDSVPTAPTPLYGQAPAPVYGQPPGDDVRSVSPRMQTELRGAVRACFAEVTAGGPGGASGKVKMKVTLMPSGAVRLDEVTVELEPRPPAGIEAAVKKCLEGKLRSVKNDLPPTNPLPVSLTQGVTSASQGP